MKATTYMHPHMSIIDFEELACTQRTGILADACGRITLSDDPHAYYPRRLATGRIANDLADLFLGKSWEEINHGLAGLFHENKP